MSAGSAIHALAVPTPFAVGRVNCYLVEDDPLTLVDAGPNSATSLTTLEAALAEHGRRVEDLERIVITHQHIDHIGLVAILADRSGAEVCALDALAPWLARYSEVMEADDAFAEAIMLRHGIPPDIVIALRAVTRSFRAWGASCSVGTPVADGGLLEFAGRAWRVHHRPGHSPSDTVFHDEASGELVGGDHLIKPFSYPELRARIEALLRRADARRRPGRLRIGELEIDAASRMVRLRGAPIELSQKEFALVRTLASDPTRVFTKDELLRTIWGFRTLGSNRCRAPYEAAPRLAILERAPPLHRMELDSARRRCCLCAEAGASRASRRPAATRCSSDAGVCSCAWETLAYA